MAEQAPRRAQRAEGERSEPGAPAFLILAAGEGSRMRSRTPKVLHALCGRPLVRHTVELARACGAARTVVVVGRVEPQIRELLAGEPVEFARQEKPLGTGHAVLQAAPLLRDHPGPVVVLNADNPLIRPTSLTALLEQHRAQAADLTVVTAELPDPGELGRILRNPDGGLARIVEHADARPEVRAIREINAGVYAARADFLFAGLERLGTENAQGEYLLTDLVLIARKDGRAVGTFTLADRGEAFGINSRVELARAESVLQTRIQEALMLSGVTFEDPARTRVEAGVIIGQDTVISANVSLRGRTRIGRDCRIAEGCVIEDSELGDGVWIKPGCAIEESLIGDRCKVGPSAHLRPGSKLGADVRVGNFVEVKNSTLGAGTKADHLSYIGDADIGAGVTIGCGAITVNYDGEKKSRTVIGDRAFVGCNSNLIAPVEIAAEAYVAAGSTITQAVPEGALGVGRARQRNIEGWRRRRFGEGSED
jgi:bifunctional UDP-N-acetylglucosamine pyrophosphorylase / glucosamine-1-phosphate N-acetyltransferase